METNDFLAEVYELEDEAWGSFSISLKEEDDVQNRSFIPLYIPLKRAKNCTKGKACGNSCIAQNKQCRKTLPPAAAAAVPTVAKNAPKKTLEKGKTTLWSSQAPQTSGSLPTTSASNPQAVAQPPTGKTYKQEVSSSAGDQQTMPKQTSIKPNYNPDLDKASIDKDFHRLYDLAAGVIAPQDIDVSDGLAKAKSLLGMNSYYFEQYQKPKIEKIIKESPDIKNEEAATLAHWIGGGYEDMNKRIYAPNSFKSPKKEGLLTIDEIATIALHKLPPITTQQVEKEAVLKNQGFDPQEPLKRFVTIKTDVDAFVKGYQEAVDNGEPYLEKIFFATTHLRKEQMGYFSENANVRYLIKPKLDGTGSGRYIDHYKNAANEGEILYPPMTKFKVSSVKKVEYLLTPKDEKVLEKYKDVETAKMISFGSKTLTFEAAYELVSGKKKPSKNTLIKLEADYKKVKEKELKQTGDFTGYIIEMEEI